MDTDSLFYLCIMRVACRAVVAGELDVGRTEGRWAAKKGQDVGRMCDGSIIQPDRSLCQEGRRMEIGGGRTKDGGRMTRGEWPMEHFSCSPRSLTEANDVKAFGKRRETTLSERRSWFGWFQRARITAVSRAQCGRHRGLECQVSSSKKLRSRRGSRSDSQVQ
jgi:hypothetical protein